MSDRRYFLRQLVAASGLLATPSFISSREGEAFVDILNDRADTPAELLATDEDYWYAIQQSYTTSTSILNLNNGGVCPQPRIVQDAMERYNRLCNEAPSYYMWQILDMGREPLRAELAHFAGCEPEELAINRNASEALETVIFGLRLQAGDEIVLSRYDYPNMINAWKQRSMRDGIVLKWVEPILPSADAEALTETYVSAFSDRTKVVHLTHMINWNGQILPVRQIANHAQQRGIEVLVDGAHSFAHIDYKIPDLNCDYFGSSLHKWLGAPFGSGLLYVRKDKISNLYPLLAAPDPESSDIRKFESLGTRSFPIEHAIAQALNFQLAIGTLRKQRRLQYLKEYWTSGIEAVPGISFGTNLQPANSCALCLMTVQNKKPEEISSALFQKYKIHTVAISWENIRGIRITPNVYTVTRDLDRLITAVTQLQTS